MWNKRRMLCIEGEYMTEEFVIDAINLVRKYKSETSTIEIKSRAYISSNIIKPLINDGKLDYVNKKRANAKNQKYITK